MVQMAENGVFNKNEKKNGLSRNLINSPLFVQSAKEIGNRQRIGHPEYEVTNDIHVQSKITDVRKRIVNRLKVLKRDQPAPLSDIFSKRFLDDFDWITKKREEAVRFAVNSQKDFVREPMNPLLLKALKQEDIAKSIGCHVSTVSRLIKELNIEFPDTVVRDFSLLVPSTRLTSLQARYVLGNFMNDPEYFDKKPAGKYQRKIWLPSSERSMKLMCSVE